MSFAAMKSFFNKYRKEHPFVFYFMAVYLGGLSTYLIIFTIWFADYTTPMSLNEVGDFLAGAFSPIAFLFLYLGYRQNSEALQIQADELRQSTEALQLQVAEMKESVEQQKLLGEIQKTELEERHNSVTPFITTTANIEVNHEYNGNIFLLVIGFKNNSDYDAKNIVYVFENSMLAPPSILAKNSHRRCSFKLENHEIEKYKAQTPFELDAFIEFDNIYGRHFKQDFKIECLFQNGSAKVYIQDRGISKYTQSH